MDAWKQAQLSPRRGGLGLRPLSLHAPAAFISSLCSSDSATPSHSHLTSSITLFNNCVPLSEAVSVHSLLSNPPSQRQLSDVIKDSQFASLYNSMSCANKARVSSPHTSAWLSVVPSEDMGLHLNPCELNIAVKWWLGLNPHSENNAIPQTCPLCPESMLDPLCHHSVTCKRVGDVTNRHNLLRNAVYEACRQASLSVRLEAGGGLGKDKALTRPADILVSNPVVLLVLLTISLLPHRLTPQLFWKREFQQVQQPKQQRCVNIPSMLLSALN